MPPVVIDVKKADDPRDIVHRAVQSLVEGKLVAFPTETVYGLAASALDEATVMRLVRAKGRHAGHAMALAIRSADEARDYLPNMSPLAYRLARRCWPGPVTLVMDGSHPDSLVRQLPPGVREVVCPQKTLGFRVPGHNLILEVLQMMAGPFVLTSANRTGGPSPVTAADVLQSLGDDVDVILDDGACRFGQPSVVVQIEDDHYRILRPGVVPESTLKRLASVMLLFVCTGNTCRSPMAEAFARHYLAKKLACPPDELEDHGVLVMSAGVAAMMGGRASPEAVSVMAEMGIDLRNHETQPLSEALVRHADRIFTLGRSHREAILAQWPEAAERTVLLSTSGADIADPIGGAVERYQRCASQIRAEIESRLDDFPLQGHNEG